MAFDYIVSLSSFSVLQWHLITLGLYLFSQYHNGIWLHWESICSVNIAMIFDQIVIISLFSVSQSNLNKYWIYLFCQYHNGIWWHCEYINFLIITMTLWNIFCLSESQCHLATNFGYLPFLSTTLALDYIVIRSLLSVPQCYFDILLLYPFSQHHNGIWLH